jgi:hypothetical protein
VQLLGLQWISIIIACIYVIDNVISFIVISGFRKTTKQVNRKERTDDTEQITQRVRAILSQKSFLHRRFVNAYPKLQAIQIKIKEIKNKIEDATNEAKDVVAEKTGEIKNRIENATNEAKDVINEKFEKNTRKVKVRLYLGKRYIRTKFRGKKFGK